MAVLLNKFEDMSYAEIAEVMGRSPAAIKSLLARARNQLRERLEPYLADRPARGGRSTPPRDASRRRAAERRVPKMSQMTSRPSSMRRHLARGLASLRPGGRTTWCSPGPAWSAAPRGPSLHGPFCAPCRADAARGGRAAAIPACPRCALPVGPLRRPPTAAAPSAGATRLGFDAALALGPYEGPVRDLCLLLKHERNAWLARWLGDLLAEARQAELARLPRDAWVVPVPAPLVAAAPPAVTTRPRPWPAAWPGGSTFASTSPSGGSRPPILWPTRGHRADARPCTGPSRPGAIRGLKGRTILLVDDILTTGATSGAGGPGPQASRGQARRGRRPGDGPYNPHGKSRRQRGPGVATRPGACTATPLATMNHCLAPARRSCGSAPAAAAWPAGRPSWVADRLASLPSRPRSSSSSRSRPTATATGTRPWPRSAGRACSPRRSSARPATARSTWPSTASRTCRRRGPRTWSWPPCPRARTWPMP